MALELTVPEEITRLSTDRLEEMFGRSTVQRGTAYHRQGAVTHLRVSDDSLVATVRGTRRYQTEVIVDALGARGLRALGSEVLTSCSCPVAEDCKHAVAVILAAQARARVAARLTPSGNGVPQLPWHGDDEVQRPGPARHAMARPASPAGPARWETMLAPLIAQPDGARPAGRHLEPLAVLLDVGGLGHAGELRLRPLRRGASGAWVRSGISWDQMAYAQYGGRFDPAHIEAICAVQDTQRPSSRYYSASRVWLDAETLGTHLWRLLDDLVAAGVELVTGSGSTRPVCLATQPATVSIDVTRAPDGDLVVGASLALPDDLGDVQGAPHATAYLIGRPGTGLAVSASTGDLTLVRLDQTLRDELRPLLSESVVVPAADETRFLGRYYPLLRRAAPVGSSNASVDLPTITPPRLGLVVEVEPDHVLRLRWTFRYAVGEQVVEVPLLADPASPGAHVLRDWEAEETLLASLDVLDAVGGLRIPVPGKRRLGVVVEPVLSGWDTVRFVRGVLPLLHARSDIDVTVVGELLDYAEAGEPPVVAVSTHDLDDEPGSGLPEGAAQDWFDLGIGVTVGGEDVPLSTLLTALTLGEERLILPSGTWFALDVPELQALRRIVEEARDLHDPEAESLRINRYQAGLWEELVELGVVTHQSSRWAATVSALLALTEVPHPDQPEGVAATLRSYQLEGYQWLSFLWDHRLGGVLADDMGLGKTLQTLAMAERARAAGELTVEAPLLVVAPTSVVSVWASEAAKFTPGLRVATVTQTTTRARRRLDELVAGAHIVVTSYALLRIDESHYCERAWAGLVLDEAQFVKNHQTKAYQVARRLPAPVKLAITGTPLENSLMDLWSLLSIVAPGLFPSPQRFSELYRKPIESGSSPELLATLRRRIRPLMLRRTKDSVALDLPPKVEQVVSVPLAPQHRRIYDTHLQRERQRILGLLDDVQRNRIAILSALTTLRQLSLDVHLVEADAPASIRSSKVDALLDQLVEVVAEGHRCLVFSQFTRFLAIVRERLQAEGIDHVYLDGRTRDRGRRIADFTEGEAPVFLISLKAGGSGLTLTEADYVFVLDPWWNPAVEAQAVDRTHRIGQDRTVMVYRLVSEGTIEEKVVALQERKRELFARVVDDGGLMGAPLSADDIRGLLEG